MTMPMRERMARAGYERMMQIMKERFPAGASEGLIIDETWETTSEQCRTDWLLSVDAALDALMEPTCEMIEAGERETNVWNSTWQAMIRAAKEGA